jgi:hypothetical protein
MENASSLQSGQQTDHIVNSSLKRSVGSTLEWLLQHMSTVPSRRQEPVSQAAPAQPILVDWPVTVSG